MTFLGIRLSGCRARAVPMELVLLVVYVAELRMLGGV